MKKIILIKLGGSLITEKDKPYTSRSTIIKSLAKEIKKIIAAKKNTVFLLGNGGGSFAHYPAKKYHIHDTANHVFGYAAVQDGASQLNRIVVGTLLQQGIAATSLHPSSFLTSIRGKKKALFTDSLFGLLNMHITPVIYGDIVYDEKKGYHIFSTEDLFSVLIPELTNKKYEIEKIIQLTSVAGVLDGNKQIIPVITQKNLEEVKKHIFRPKGFDVTGGMLHKIQTALSYAKLGIPTYIIKGDTNEKLLTKAVSGKESRGTIIC